MFSVQYTQSSAINCYGEGDGDQLTKLLRTLIQTILSAILLIIFSLFLMLIRIYRLELTKPGLQTVHLAKVSNHTFKLGMVMGRKQLFVQNFFSYFFSLPLFLSYPLSPSVCVWLFFFRSQRKFCGLVAVIVRIFRPVAVRVNT